MKYNKFVIVAGNELDWRIKTQFCIDNLVGAGLDVEYWNVSSLTYNIRVDSDIFPEIHYEKFEERERFVQKVDEYSKQPILYLVYMNYTPTTYFLFRTFTKYNCTLAYCLNGIIPLPSKSLMFKLKHYDVIRAIKSKIYRFLLKTALLKSVKYQFNTCLESITDYKQDDSTIVVPFQTLDLILTQNTEENIVGKPYYVFVDQYLPYHSDNKAGGYNNIPPENYYHQLNKLFDVIERETGVDVIIAAHPIAKRYIENNPFEGRCIYFNKTQTLVRYCAGVINHFSTAISFTVIYRKPSIALVSDDMITYLPSQSKSTYYRSKLIGAPVINIDHLPKTSISFKMDEQKYYDYQKKYIVMPGAEKMSNDKVILSIMQGEYE